MNILNSILFWAGIIFLIDGSLGILVQEKWKKWVGGLNILRIAVVEIGIGMALLAAHYILL